MRVRKAIVFKYYNDKWKSISQWKWSILDPADTIENYKRFEIDIDFHLSCWFLFIIHIDTVEIGGSGNVRLGRNDYVYVKAASKPSGMALRLADKLFPKTTLMRSTVHGTKDFAPLDPTIISAIKGQWSILIHMHITCVILYFLVCFLVIHLFIFLCHFTCCKIKCPTTTSVSFQKRCLALSSLSYGIIYWVMSCYTPKNIFKGNGSG